MCLSATTPVYCVSIHVSKGCDLGLLQRLYIWKRPSSKRPPRILISRYSEKSALVISDNNSRPAALAKGNLCQRDPKYQMDGHGQPDVGEL